MIEQPIRRRAARVILLDAAGRVLLLAARDPGDGRVVWFAPGGGVEAGETLEQAAARELAEEVPAAAGLPLAGPVWTRRHEEFYWNRQRIDQTEWYFVTRLRRPLAAGGVGPAPGDEGSYFVEARWLSVAELRAMIAAGDIVAPRRLPELLPPLIAGELPAEPIDAGV